MNRAVRAFTLLEVVVVVAILALISGIVVPVAGVMIRQANTEETVDRLETVGRAIERFFEDTWTFPDALTDLAEDPGLDGWAGPYLTMGYVADETGLADLEVDGFGTPFRLERLDDDRLLVRSFGADRANGGGDDLERVVNVAPIRRRRTLERIAVFDAAILAYNRNRGDQQPALPPDVAAAHELLAQYGYLPGDAELRIDGWGDELVPDPPGSNPLVGVTSVHLGGEATGKKGLQQPGFGRPGKKGPGGGKSKKKPKKGGRGEGKHKGHGNGRGKGKGKKRGH